MNEMFEGKGSKGKFDPCFLLCSIKIDNHILAQNIQSTNHKIFSAFDYVCIRDVCLLKHKPFKFENIFC